MQCYKIYFNLHKLTTIGNKTDIIDNDNHSISKSHIPGLVLLDLSEVIINGN